MLWVRIALWGLYFILCRSESLVVNIANKGGDVFQEKFYVNSTEDILKLSFEQFDGSIVKLTVDFKAAIQTFRLLILPFRDVSDSVKQELCFVLPLDSGEFISTDAMSKLRQKNPHTIRRPDEDLPPVRSVVDSPITADVLSILPQSVRDLCSSKEAQIFTESGNSSASLPPSVLPCNETTSWKNGCRCSYSLCVVWYPCDLKYCKSEPVAGDAEPVEYRCGIKTCRKCRTFVYPARRKMDCLWNLLSVELVHASTNSFRAALNHTKVAQFTPFMASVVLHLSHIPAYRAPHEIGVLCLYANGLIAVFWSNLNIAQGRWVVFFFGSGLTRQQSISST
ncbi:putative Out at first protein [Hypsibius exemplaris]|uniref:Out at first protein n=1 Tax=Hypsibius exemplaris TaxID=2072580 RepID=A0A9X6NJV0_HYPEX|nr:putative Out at first protein [Hypsibius exemplaris]